MNFPHAVTDRQPEREGDGLKGKIRSHPISPSNLQSEGHLSVVLKDVSYDGIEPDRQLKELSVRLEGLGELELLAEGKCDKGREMEGVRRSLNRINENWIDEGEGEGEDASHL